MNKPRLQIQAAEYLRLWHTLFYLDIEHLLRNPEELSEKDLHRARDFCGCKVGEWIAAQRRAIGDSEEFVGFDAIHREFHETSSSVLETLKEGKEAKINELVAELSDANDRLTHELSCLLKMLRHKKMISVDEDHSTGLRLWDPSYEIGIPQIDREHRTIMTLIELAVPSPASEFVDMTQEAIVKKLFRLIRTEVMNESALIEQMIKDGVPSAPKHKESHQSLLEFLSSAETDGMDTEKIADHLGRWYVEHLVIFDEDMRDYVVHY